MANLKKIKKDLLKLSPEDLKEALEFLVDDEEVKEEVVDEKVKTKEEVKVKVEETVEQPKKEVGLTEEKLVELLKEFGANFVTKEEIKEVKEKVDKVGKKATKFGADGKPEKTDVKEEVNMQDYISRLNTKFTG